METNFKWLFLFLSLMNHCEKIPPNRLLCAIHIYFSGLIKLSFSDIGCFRYFQLQLALIICCLIVYRFNNVWTNNCAKNDTSKVKTYFVFLVFTNWHNFGTLSRDVAVAQLITQKTTVPFSGLLFLITVSVSPFFLHLQSIVKKYFSNLRIRIKI
jgi:hypothetical protein